MYKRRFIQRELLYTAPSTILYATSNPTFTNAKNCVSTSLGEVKKRFILPTSFIDLTPFLPSACESKIEDDISFLSLSPTKESCHEIPRGMSNRGKSKKAENLPFMIRLQYRPRYRFQYIFSTSPDLKLSARPLFLV